MLGTNLSSIWRVLSTKRLSECKKLLVKEYLVWPIIMGTYGFHSGDTARVQRIRSISFYSSVLSSRLTWSVRIHFAQLQLDGLVHLVIAARIAAAIYRVCLSCLAPAVSFTISSTPFIQHPFFSSSSPLLFSRTRIFFDSPSIACARNDRASSPLFTHPFFFEFRYYIFYLLLLPLPTW